jgi:hypothetical protein
LKEEIAENARDEREFEDLSKENESMLKLKEEEFKAISRS